ncbi:dihydrodipicolinate synthase family protein [Serinicoccus marinus]|uniref:dihydrodipicolinate synthase family protein n=1 Tax=Serinicoccus marinus TaxID=247333 RepID=UPI0003B760FF|nr:dihydrodipicolinate synthase family protein [Serinicoccus marinus]
MTSPTIFTATPTAFHPDGSLDLEGSRAILEHISRSGNEGAFVLGTTGEFAALTVAERGQVVEAAMNILGHHMRVVVHVGAASVYEVLQLVEQARAAGAREIALITPYYLPATDAAMLDFFTTADAACDGLDLFVYAYARRTGNSVSTELMARLAELPHVVGAKVSEEPLEQLQAYRSVVPDGFQLYTGADRDILAVGAVGAQGVVSGVSSVLPRPFRTAAAAADQDDDARAAAQADVDEACDVIAGDIARMKEAYRVLGVTDTTTRMAIEAPDAATRQLIVDTVRRLS